MKCLSACLLLLLATPFAALAADAPPRAAAAAPKADPRAELARRIPGSKAEDFRPSPVPGLYELAQGAEIVYVTSDGKYAFAGDLYDLNDDTNLSERRRRDSRLALISSVPEAQMLVFSPKDPKYTITVFTDIDCGYCRKLHSEMPEYNKLGIRVRYLYYPRMGPDSEGWDKAQAVACATNKTDAMTRAKRGESVKSGKCNASSIVQRDYELGQEIGLRGTPAIILEDGELLAGYVPPAMLIRRLEPPAAQR
jgi:thiol:disulfide interchange protein DsbC